MLRRVSCIAICFSLLAAHSPAKASLWSGACIVNVTFNFLSPIRATTTSPSYNVSLSGGIDLDPLTAGVQACAITLDALEPLRKTSASGSGSSTIWSCGATLASGSWEQEWRDASGNLNPPRVNGSHSIVGTWDDWTMELRVPSLSFVGVAELTLAPFENLKAVDCLNGINSLTMSGVMVFQDP